MAKSKPTFRDWLQNNVIRVARLHFYLVAVYAVYTIASHATDLVTPMVVLQRWMVNGFLLAGCAIVWYAARHKVSSHNYYRALLYSLMIIDIAFATFNVYTQRGMASRAVFLYVIPIVVSAVLLSRVAIFMTAALATAAYVLTAVKYFVDYFNEGYTAELYIEVGFYSAMFFVVAGLMSLIIRFNKSESDLSL